MQFRQHWAKNKYHGNRDYLCKIHISRDQGFAWNSYISWSHGQDNFEFFMIFYQVYFLIWEHKSKIHCQV